MPPLSSGIFSGYIKGYRNHVKILVVCTQINDIIQAWIRGQKYETYYH